jgi:Xaa-Pro aminopeptidase
MAEEITIDKNNFFNRLSTFYASWKADKRSGNALFGNAGSMVILMGKTDEENSFQKNNAMHVCETSSKPYPSPIEVPELRDVVTNRSCSQFWLLGYEFPATLFVLTTEAIYVVTTAKKGECQCMNFCALHS